MIKIFFVDKINISKLEARKNSPANIIDIFLKIELSTSNIII